MQDLITASQISYQIGLPLGAAAWLVGWRFGQLFALVFLGWALLFYLAQYLPWTYLGL